MQQEAAACKQLHLSSEWFRKDQRSVVPASDEFVAPQIVAYGVSI